MLFAGVEDQVWPSVRMADEIKRRATQASSVAAYYFEAAGHTFSSGGAYDGGSFDGNLYAFHQARKLLHTILKEWHPKKK